MRMAQSRALERLGRLNRRLPDSHDHHDDGQTGESAPSGFDDELLLATLGGARDAPGGAVGGGLAEFRPLSAAARA
ncbi:MAG: hypothetical protein U0W40_00990 [Acidimicrobiia bacterium]